VYSKPFRNVADKTDWNGTFIASETIIDDPSDGRFAGRAFPANDIYSPRLKRDDARAKARVFGPKNDFENR
jgi:hypothetical protein